MTAQAKSAEEVFYEYANRFDWDFPDMANVLVAYLGESVIGPLLAFIQEVGLTVDFEAYLADNWQDEAPGSSDDRDLGAAADAPDRVGLEQLVRELIESPPPSQVGAQTQWQQEGF